MSVKTYNYRCQNDNGDCTYQFQQVIRPRMPKRSRRTARCCGPAVVVVSSCVTRSRLIHARAFLSCQSKRFLFQTLGRSLSIFFSFSTINGVLEDACRWYRLSAGDTRMYQPRGTYESLNSPESKDANRSRDWKVTEQCGGLFATTWQSRRRNEREKELTARHEVQKCRLMIFRLVQMWQSRVGARIRIEK